VAVHHNAEASAVIAHNHVILGNENRENWVRGINHLRGEQ